MTLHAIYDYTSEIDFGNLPTGTSDYTMLFTVYPSATATYGEEILYGAYTGATGSETFTGAIVTSGTKAIFTDGTSNAAPKVWTGTYLTGSNSTITTNSNTTSIMKVPPYTLAVNFVYATKLFNYKLISSYDLYLPSGNHILAPLAFISGSEVGIGDSIQTALMSRAKYTNMPMDSEVR